jgi:ParB/RepB/Spo0J family partition protein
MWNRKSGAVRAGLAATCNHYRTTASPRPGTETDDGTVYVKTADIFITGGRNARRVDPMDEHDQLFIRSILRHGVLAPIAVRRMDGRFELVFGARRLAAARHLGMATIPARIIDASDALMRLIIDEEASLRKPMIMEAYHD